jgi:hypothetical protein
MVILDLIVIIPLIALQDVIAKEGGLHLSSIAPLTRYTNVMK